MSKLPIIQNGNPVLRKVSLAVPKELFGTPELEQIISNMAEALDEQPDGVALAAPQVGISYRIFIVRFDRTVPVTEDSSTTPKADIGVFINPKFIRSSRRRSEVDEGCLSVRGLYGSTLRTSARCPRENI